MLKDECYPKRRLDRKTEESITSSARAGTRKRKELSIWLKRPTNVLYLYTLISYQSATLALPLRYKGVMQGESPITLNCKKMNYFQQRNQAIREHFYHLLDQGYPLMLAYTMTGKQFYLSEERVRQIVAKRKC